MNPRKLTPIAALLLCSGLALGKAKEERKKDAVDEVADRYKKARNPQKGQTVQLAAGDCKGFAKDFQKAGEKEKAREADGLFNAGVVLDECGLPKDAEEMYRKALAKNPKHLQAMSNLGVIYKSQGRQNEAISQFDQVLRTNGKSPLAVQAYTNKAVILYERLRASGATGEAAYQEVVQTLRRALAVDSDSMFAYNMLATVFLQTAESDRSKLKLADLVCESALKLNDDYAPIYNTRGLIKLRGKDVSGALAEFRKAVNLDPNLIDAQLNIAAISLSVRSYKQAEDAFQQVLKKEPNNLDAVIGMGVAQRGQKKVPEAEEWYKKAGQLDPKNCSVSYNLGVLYQDYKGGAEGELRKAQEFYNKFASCVGRDTETVRDAKRRVKDIDDTFKAIEEQKKLEAELKKQQEEMERQQKLMEQQQGGAGAAPTPPAK